MPKAFNSTDRLESKEYKGSLSTNRYLYELLDNARHQREEAPPECGSTEIVKAARKDMIFSCDTTTPRFCIPSHAPNSQPNATVYALPVIPTLDSSIPFHATPYEQNHP
jgi:hypothetical protein